MGRVVAQEDLCSDRAPTSQPTSPIALKLVSLEAGYDESMVLHGISLDVRPGHVMCLMGRNGVGKTTLLKSIVGLIRPRGGDVLLDNLSILALPTDGRARRGIAYVPQGRGIFPYLSVMENLAISLEVSRVDRISVLDEMMSLFPVLATMARRSAGTLSGGQQQQLAIARALAQRPGLLLLDEPTEGIQPSIIDQIGDVIAAIRRERRVSVVLVEQFLEFALGVGDDYCIMEKGAVVASGPIASLDAADAREYLAI
jgi:urea transport system ATP-binding protein